MAGPTGVGKSLFAAGLASSLGGEILGADAYQVYSGLTILTAQPGPDLLRQVPHHLIGILPPSEPFDAARFRRMALAAVADIQSRGRIPIITGGTGLYIKALTHGLAELPPPDLALRAELRALSPEEALQRLDTLDLLDIPVRPPREIDAQHADALVGQTQQHPGQREDDDDV